MFGFLRPCRHHLTPALHARWSEHLCGLCLTLRDEAGQLARATTHVDALVVSVLAEAQGVGGRRRAGPCPLRGMRAAPVVTGDGARLAASTALLLAADAVDDHVDDGDGPFARRPMALAGARVAGTWSRAGSRTATGVGFDATELLAVPARQREAEGAPAVTLAAATAPTEAAVGSALAHTAVLAGRPGNVGPLDEAGRLLGRLAHLLDAVADLDDDAAAGRWNPLAATGTGRAAALARCRDAVVGIRSALGRVVFAPDADVARQLAHRLLVHEAGRAVDREGLPTRPPSRPPRGLLGGCAAAAGLCCTGQLCCADEFVGPWSGQPRQGWCSSCTDGCSCGCDCCDCCSDCDGCCSCDCS